MFGLGIFGTGVLTLLTPVAAEYGGLWAVFAVRIIEGLTEGVSYPAMHAVFCKWAPPLERSRMVSWAYSGSLIGNTFTQFSRSDSQHLQLFRYHHCLSRRGVS